MNPKSLAAGGLALSLLLVTVLGAPAAREGPRAMAGFLLAGAIAGHLGALAGLVLLVRKMDENARRAAALQADIAVVKKRERELEAANKELEAFTYSVSHDLRAPLRAVDGFATILAEESSAALDQEGRRLVARIRDNSALMGRLIHDLLGFCRLGRQEVRRQEVDMAGLARLAAAENAAAEPGRRVAVDIAALSFSTGDVAMLTQVWRNLLSNAFKYTRSASAPRVEIGSRDASGAVEYWVKDNGVGFDPACAHKLFNVFSRLHPAEQFEGTGLGLALVRRIVERHGGSISATGRPNAGAEIRFFLPRRTA